MRVFFGILIGLFLAAGIAIGAAYMAFGDLSDVGRRDRANDVSQSFDFADFDSIDVGGVFELDVSVGSAYAVTVSGTPADMERLEAVVENGVLSLGRKGPEVYNRRSSRHGMTAVISVPALSAIDVSGIVDAEVAGVQASAFRADLSGVGDLEISGTCETLTVSVSGVGDFDGRDLECRSVDVRVSGIGDANVYASESVDANVSGIGSIDIYGEPSQVEKTGGFLSSVKVH